MKELVISDADEPKGGYFRFLNLETKKLENIRIEDLDRFKEKVSNTQSKKILEQLAQSKKPKRSSVGTPKSYSL